MYGLMRSDNLGLVANNFWGKDDAGVGPLLQRMHAAKQTCDELKAFYTARASIEDEYARRLLSLCKKPLGSQEMGGLKISMDTLRGEVEAMAKQHQNIAAQMKSELEEPLSAFSGAMKERRKIVQNGIEKLLKTKMQQTQHVNKTRDRYEQECLKIKGYLAQGHMVMGQEERKNKAKLEKTQIALAASNSEYETAVRVLEETTARWNREWKSATDKFQDLEEERLDFTKSSLWAFANIASTVCVTDDASCEKIRLSLEQMDVEKDIVSFITERGTGQEIPDPPKYINFRRGDVDITSEASEDENYSVAQFPRSINPAFRTSSPQPSTYESHHEPRAIVSEKKEPQLEPFPVQPRDSSQFHSQTNSQPQQRHMAQISDTSQQAQVAIPSSGVKVTNVPQDPHPEASIVDMNGIELPLDSGSNIAPIRSFSRDSQNHDGPSNPSSLAHVESAGISPSPTKQVGQVASTSISDSEKRIMKKRSGFFQSHSPFRRKSTKDKDAILQPSHSQSSKQQTMPQNQNSQSDDLQRASTGQTYGLPQQHTQQQPPQTAAQPPTDMKHNSISSRGGWNQSANQVPKQSNTYTHQTLPQAQHQQQHLPPPSRLITSGRDASPDPIEANATLALGVGPNVLPVSANSGRNRGNSSPTKDEGDPIAMALAELKDASTNTKQSSSRVSIDRYAGIATPGPGFLGNSAVQAAKRGTPPPSYDQQVQRLGAPPPAHTAKAMKEASEKFVGQTRSMFGEPNGYSSSSLPRTGTRHGARGNDGSRSTSPAPMRNSSRMGDNTRSSHRSMSPSPHTGHQQIRSNSRVSIHNHSMNKRGSDQSYYRPDTRNGPLDHSLQSRPGSSHTGGDMSMQLASPSEGDYGMQLERAGSRPVSRPGTSNSSRGVGLYDGSNQGSLRPRSKSFADPSRQYSRDGRPILHLEDKTGCTNLLSIFKARAMYMYQAAIPEELGFSKGDTLAILKHQDDGWWEAEVHGVGGRVGLVPSNYLQTI
ncbi:cell division control protein [Ceratocystis lukuohia]|uniref:Cell division control protein n=1 Tax=Ceratocystis lukuohia TaxID=2019550 RepID=A0ABR4MIQ5_9PEZI